MVASVCLKQALEINRALEQFSDFERLKWIERKNFISVQAISQISSARTQHYWWRVGGGGGERKIGQRAPLRSFWRSVTFGGALRALAPNLPERRSVHSASGACTQVWVYITFCRHKTDFTLYQHFLILLFFEISASALLRYARK